MSAVVIQADREAAKAYWEASVVGWREQSAKQNALVQAFAAHREAHTAGLLETLHQYVSDLRYPPTGDSIQRRIERAEAVIAKATGAAK